jgi:hypothetical protein
MSRLIRCDRCGAVAEIGRRSCPGWPEGWEVVPDPNGQPDPIFGVSSDSIDACPGCLTPEERADCLIRDVTEAVYEW